MPLVRGSRRLPAILEPAEVEALDGGAAHPAGPGHGPGHAAGRAAALRGARAAPRRTCASASGGCFVADGKGGHQRLVPMSRDVLRHRRRLPERRAASGCDHGPAVRRAEGTTAGTAAVGSRARRGAHRRPGSGRADAAAPATSCATPASPGCGRPAWPSRRSRPRPATAPSPRPGSTCTSAMTGWPNEYRRASEAIEAQVSMGSGR